MTGSEDVLSCGASFKSSHFQLKILVRLMVQGRLLNSKGPDPGWLIDPLVNHKRQLSLTRKKVLMMLKPDVNPD